MDDCTEKAFQLTVEAKKEINRITNEEVEDICFECAIMLTSCSLPLLINDEEEEIDIKCCWNCKHFEQEVKSEHFSEFSMCCKDDENPYNVEKHYRCSEWKNDSN